MNNQMNNAIKLMTEEIVQVLEGLSPSVYLYGSVALDDFREGWSDIDILVLTEGEMSGGQAEYLVGLRQEMCERHGGQYFRLFEGNIISAHSFLAKQNGRTVYWGTSGQRIKDCCDLNSFDLKEIYESGILLYGADIRGKMTCPTYGELKKDVIRHYDAIRKYAQKTERNLYSFGWLLDIARCLYTLRTGEIAAKTAAGEWALQNNLCPVPETLKKVLEIRREPLAYKERGDILDYAETLGGDVQKFADVLEKELKEDI